MEKYCKTLFQEITSFSENPNDDWFSESNISRMLVRYLNNQDYTIRKDNSDTPQKKGVDIIVIKNGIKEYIEVKGYPSIYYKEEKRRKEKKKTKPELQCTHYLDGCLSSMIKNYKSKEIALAMAFPACAQYERLIYERQLFFTDNNADVRIYFVKEDGSVVIDNMNRRLGINRELTEKG